jgi:hypothetical protein
VCVLAGGTIGHYLCNVWVVDDRGGNVSFIKAFGRMIIKSLLGWYSFLAMVMTSRHQAVHDLLTRSTVQMRDLTKSKPYHFRALAGSADTAGHALTGPARSRDCGLSACGLHPVFDLSCDARPCRPPFKTLH